MIFSRIIVLYGNRSILVAVVEVFVVTLKSPHFTMAVSIPKLIKTRVVSRKYVNNIMNF